MLNRIKNILVPVNFTNSSQSAITTAVAMCQRHGAILHLLYVREGNWLLMTGNHAGTLEMTIQAEVATQDKLEQQAKEIASKSGIVCFFYTAKESMYLAIASKAKDLHIDLLVLEQPKLPSLFSIDKPRSIYKLLSTAECPILSVPARKRILNFKNILLPIRAVPSGIKKLEFALPIIKRNKSKVILLPVRTAPKGQGTDMVERFTLEANKQMIEEGIQREESDGLVDRISRQVIRKAKEKEVDLIIITASLKKGFLSSFRTNYTERILRNSAVPVLSVKET